MPHTRIAALRALIRLHRARALTTVITPLTERYKPQLLQLAAREKDMNVRVSAIQLAVIFGKQGAWETDEERNRLCRLIVHPQPRIRKGRITGIVTIIYVYMILNGR
jgi:cohesin complex subunit SA-1/2